MMQSNQPGYPLPSGTLGDDDIVCQLVYLPDRDEYWRALYAALHYFTTWIAWERDDDKRGKDAASNWRAAFELTTECWRMACLEDLTNDVAAILALLQGKKDCCDNNLTYGPQTEVETDIDPGEGDPPDYYGETEISSWDDWYEHVCYNAHRYVDALVEQAELFDNAVQFSFWTIGLVAAGLAILSFTGIGLAVSIAFASTVLYGLLTAATGTFGDTADDIEDARTDIVCAFLQGTSLSEAIADALGDTSAEWLLFFQWPDYDSAQAIIYEGGYNGEYLPTETKDDCVDCGYTQLFEDDLYIKIPSTYGVLTDYTDGVWTFTSQTKASCKVLWVQFFEDAAFTTLKDVRLEFLSCSGSVRCSTNYHHQGFMASNPPFTYQLDHPTLPDVDDGVLNQIYDTHNDAAQFVVTMRIYDGS